MVFCAGSFFKGINLAKDGTPRPWPPIPPVTLNLAYTNFKRELRIFEKYVKDSHHIYIITIYQYYMQNKSKPTSRYSSNQAWKIPNVCTSKFQTLKMYQKWDLTIYVLRTIELAKVITPQKWQSKTQNTKKNKIKNNLPSTEQFIMAVMMASKI